MNGVQVELLQHLLVGDLRLCRCGHGCEEYWIRATMTRMCHWGAAGGVGWFGELVMWCEREKGAELDVAVMMVDGRFCRPTPRLI
jgi:hypothetical protein